jgi:hypothetical protein
MIQLRYSRASFTRNETTFSASFRFGHQEQPPDIFATLPHRGNSQKVRTETTKFSIYLLKCFPDRLIWFKILAIYMLLAR